MDVFYIAANFLRSVELNGLSVPDDHELKARFTEICEKWAAGATGMSEIMLRVDDVAK
ncbi:MAG: hypothetical protein AAFP20_22200 [Cyanobacteria bacterium J06614_10]